MPKYRLLTSTEFERLEKEFVHFLILRGIDADSWIRIKTQSIEQAADLMSAFSDLVIEKVLCNISYLEKRTTSQLSCLHCTPTQIMRFDLESKRQPLDFEKFNPLGLEEMDLPSCQLSYGVKEYDSAGRLYTVFQYMETGYVPADAVAYRSLALLYAASKTEK